MFSDVRGGRSGRVGVGVRCRVRRVGCSRVVRWAGPVAGVAGFCGPVPWVVGRSEPGGWRAEHPEFRMENSSSVGNAGSRGIRGRAPQECRRRSLPYGIPRTGVREPQGTTPPWPVPTPPGPNRDTPHEPTPARRPITLHRTKPAPTGGTVISASPNQTSTTTRKTYITSHDLLLRPGNF